MAVFRVEHNKNYTVMSNSAAQDQNLSLKAKGLLWLMLTLPDDWNYSIKGLASMCSDGRTAVASGIDELEEKGYLQRLRRRGENGRVAGVEYMIYEIPPAGKQTAKNLETEVKLTEENRKAENQEAGNKEPENRPLQNTNIQNTNIQNTNIQNTNIPKRESVERESSGEAAQENPTAEKNTPTPTCCGGFKNVHLTEEELAALKEKLPDDYEELIERLSEYKESTGKEYKSDYATILHWSRDSERAGGKKIPKYGDPDYYAYEEGEGLCFSN